MNQTSDILNKYNNFGLGLNYFNLNKFTGPKNAYYKIIRREIEKFLPEL